MVAVSSLDLELAANDEVRSIAAAEAERMRAEVGDAAAAIFRSATQLHGTDKATLELLVLLSAAVRSYALGGPQAGKPIDPRVLRQFELLGKVIPPDRRWWQVRRGRRDIATWRAENLAGA